MNFINTIQSYIFRIIGFIKTNFSHGDTLKARIELWKLNHRLKDHYKELGEKYLEALSKKEKMDESTREELKEIIERIDSILTEEALYKEKMKNA